MNIKDAGVIWASPKLCKPLDKVKIVFEWNKLQENEVTFEFFDGDHKSYCLTSVMAGDKKAELVVTCGGKVGVHYITASVSLEDGKTYRRCGSFRLEARTLIVSDNPTVNELFCSIEEALKLDLDIVNVNGKAITYYKCADNTWDNLCFPPFAATGLRYFISTVKPIFEVLFEHQWDNGCLPDHIYGDSHPGWGGNRRIRTLMADIEINTISELYNAWVAHGDDGWVKGMLPKMEAAIEYVLSNKDMFDQNFGLIKRPHSLDEWDMQIPVSDNFINESSRFVVMNGDASALFLACGRLSEFYQVTGNTGRAAHWQEQQKHFYEVGNQIFWDGTKYQHHIHIDDMDHGSFDESNQLSMSNPWAITRGFADHKKSVSIIREYYRRWRETGDRFPWWTLQPGYPDELKYFKTEGNWSMKQGEYANGGLFPWVGGELCKAAFMHGFEKEAYEMIQDFHFAVKRDNGAVFTWYSLDGEAGINAPWNQTNYDSFCIQPWVQAILEGLAGIKSQGKLFDKVVCSPCWTAADTKKAYGVAHFPESDAYFAYDYCYNDDEISIEFTGSGKDVLFKILMPPDVHFDLVIINGMKCNYNYEQVENSKYLVIATAIQGAGKISISKKQSTS